MKRRLSSILTLPYKVFVLVSAIYAAYLAVFRFTQTQMVGIIISFSAIIVLYFAIGTYKRVCISDGFIYVSNYLREIRLPLSAIERIDGPSKWVSIRTIVVTLYVPSVFGHQIRFTPKFLQAKEIVDELREKSSK